MESGSRKTYLESGATHAHICWQNLQNKLITFTECYNTAVSMMLALALLLTGTKRGGSEQPCRYSATLPVVSGLHHHIAGTSQAGTGPQQAVTILCQVSQLPMIGTYRYSSGDWCEIMNPFLLTDILKVHILCLRVIGFSSNIQFSNIVFCLNRIFGSFIMYRQFLRNEKTFSKSQRIKNVFPNIYNGEIWSELKSNIYLTSRMSKTF